MPKLKTKKSAAKRFRKTKSGKFKLSKAFGAHLLTGKSPKRRRNMRKAAVLSKADAKRVKGMLPYA
ncbi:MAG: 50S ribosomal protein L35 [Candidatus Hydrogenedentota bacterium]